MQGAVLQQLEAYVTERLNAEAWTDMLDAAGRKGIVYGSTEQYPDEEIVTLIGTLARLTWIPAQEIVADLRGFVPELLDF